MSLALASTDFFANLEYEKTSLIEASASLNQPQYCDLKPKKLGRVELGGITQHNIKILKRLNQMIFPVNYNEKFYKYVLKAGELAKLAYYNEMIVGAVCCRVEENSDNKNLYIMTLGCLAMYRRLGIGRKMLGHVLAYAEKNKFEKITLHVQVNNETALEFYKKFGFEVVSTAYQYYKRIEPADAHVLQKTLTA